MNGKTKVWLTITCAVLASACVLAFLPTVGHAGPILLPGKLTGDKFVPDETAKPGQYTIRYSAIVATVDDGMAETKIQETIVGPGQAVDTVCLIPLPEGARAEGATVASGAPGDTPVPLPGARFLAADEAQKVYEAMAQGLERVEILALTGRPALLVPEFRLDGKVEITVQFKQPVDDVDGVQSLRCPTPVTVWADGPAARLTATVTVQDSRPLRAMFSPSHDATVQRDGLYKATARVKADRWSGEEDLRLCWVADKDDLGLRVLAYRDAENGEGYFMLLGNPTGSASDDRTIAKDVVFVLDTSGSMRGEKIEQARAAIEYCLENLNAGDRFNIVTFGTEVRSFRDALVKRSEAELAAAQDFIEELVAQGRTNISGALEKAVTDKSTAGRPHITIFLTDGTPTAGELVPEKIVESVTETQPCPTRIFVMGVGHDVNTHLLDELAEATEGSSEYVTADDEIDAKIATLYDRLSHPVLTNVLVDCGQLRTHSVYPRKLPALFKGSEFMLFGRYRDGGKHTFTVSGSLSGKATRYECRAELPSEPSSNTTAFVAPLWAARKIGYLLQEIRLHGENDELITEVVRLSKNFGIVTEYTEFIASVTGDVSTEVAVNEARNRMNMANAVQAGQWAFNQARNDRQLQQKVVATKGANFYLDRQGRRVATENIQQFDDNVFYLREGQWVDAQDQGDRRARTVKLFSKEYNDLVRNNRRFAQAQRLGWAMSINVGDERVVVENDGATQSKELLERVQQQQQAPAMQQQQMRNLQFNNRFNQMPQRQQQIQQIPVNQLPNIQINQQPQLNNRNVQEVQQQEPSPNNDR